jgi:hypothetical protein
VTDLDPNTEPFGLHDSWDDFAKTRERIAPRAFSSAELLSMNPEHVEWLVRDRLPRVGTSMLAGCLQTGKSTLARDLALSVARGKSWLGFETRQGPVLYVHLDGNLEQLRASFSARGLRAEDEIHILDSVQSPYLLGRIRERAKTLEPALIVVDGLEPLLHAEELNDQAPRSSALDRVLDLARVAGGHLLLVHDLSQNLVTEMNAILGSTERSIDTIFLLNRSGEGRLLRSIQQRGPDLIEPVPVPSFARRRSQSAPAGRGFDPLMPDEILTHLKKTGRLATQLELLDNVTDGRPEALLRAINYLRRRGHLIRVGRGVRGDPYQYTGFDRVTDPAEGPWLRRVRPWAALPHSS